MSILTATRLRPPALRGPLMKETETTEEPSKFHVEAHKRPEAKGKTEHAQNSYTSGTSVQFNHNTHKSF